MSDGKRTLARLFNIRRDEWIPVLWAGIFFFCVLTALMLLRPARDALGMQRGIDAVRWLFMGTALVTLLANPVFGWLVSRLSRLKFLAATYLFFAASLLGFFALLVFAPAAVGVTSGQVFYVWFSVFNLFATMLFWALMADRFTLEQSKRLFALISVGGTLGAIAGPGLAAALAPVLGTPALLVVSAGFLVLALVAAWGAARGQARVDPPDAPGLPAVGLPSAAGAPPGASLGGPSDALPGAAGSQARDPQRAIIGGSAWEGLRAVFRSRFLLGIAGYVIIMAVMATLLYFTRLQMVAALGEDVDLRTAMFARIDVITQVATLVLQAVVAGHVMRRLGVSLTLMLLPLTAALGFVGLAMVASIATLIVAESAFRAVQRALARPARETLYTVVSREDKYKSKAFIDTFGYRAGDVAGAQVEGWLGRLGMGLAGLASLAVPLAVAWAGLAWWLGRAQQRLAASPGTSAAREARSEGTRAPGA